MKSFLIGSILIVVLLSFSAFLLSFMSFSVEAQTSGDKKMLIFSIDQGWSNGIIQMQDNVSLQRMIFNLKQFQPKYDVYALITAKNRDPIKIEAVLDALSANGVPFILDVYGSDILTMGSDFVNNPYDTSHGLALSVGQLQTYKNKYGSAFAGIRTHEVFAESFTILACQQLGTNWCDTFEQHLPTDRFYQKALAEQYIKFAKENGMFLIWSDFYWSIYHPWDFDTNVVNQSQNERELRDLLTAYPNTVIVSFANNEPADGSRNKMNNWSQSVQPFVAQGAKGFGLSDQSWMCPSELSPEGAAYYGTSVSLLCPISEISAWATVAYSNGAKLVQFEPSWYLWQLPKGALGTTADYTKDPIWSIRGLPSQNLVELGRSLNVTVTNPPECSDECAVDQRRCYGNYSQTCGNYDSDSCLEWDTGTLCQFGCTGGACNGGPCASVVCSSPPSPYCSGNIRYYYASGGSCSAGVCSYQRFNQTCEFGCASGQCLSQNRCTDGTFYGNCSITKPFYCYYGTLVEKCSLCGCAFGTCAADNKCYSNHPPVLNAIDNKDVAEGGNLEFTVNASDPDGDAVTLFISSLPAGSSFDARTGRFAWAPSYNQTGNYWVTFYAVDDGNPARADYETIRITVGNVNRPPEMEPVGDKKTDENVLLEFTVVASDPDGDVLKYYASGLPAGAKFDNATGKFSWVPAFGQEGNYKVKVTVSDGYLNDSSEFTITVGNINRPPVAEISSPVADQEFFAGSRVLFSAAGSSDPDGDKLKYMWDFGDGETMDSENPAAEHVYKNNGKYTVSLVVIDGKMSNTKTVGISIKEPPPKDSDGDGVDDSEDKCPGTPQFAEINIYGCPMPKYTAFENNLTTDFSKVDLTNATNITIGIPGKGKVEFRKNSLNLVGKNLDKYMEIGNMSITIKTGIAPDLNRSAVITFYNVTIEDPIVARDGAYCSDCRVISYQNATFVFSVPHFTTYSLFSRISLSGYCGDGVCSIYETCGTCKEDCGGCGGAVAAPGACEEMWVCSGWSKCNELNLMTRECTDVNICGTSGKKPNEAIECGEEQDLTSFVLFGTIVMSLLIVYLATEAYKRRKEAKKMDEFELEKFVKGYVYRGFSAQEIRKILESKGYDENVIEKALKEVEKGIF